jgi:signal transduction histidine kinase
MLALVSVGCCVLTVSLRLEEPFYRFSVYGPDVVFGTVWPVVGMLVVRAQPRHVVGWVLMTPALCGPYQLLGWYADSTSGAGPLGAIAAWVAIWGFAPYYFTVPVLMQVFPDGRAASSRWRWVLRGVVVVAAVTTLARMVAPVTADLAPEVPNPLRIEGATWLNDVTGAGSLVLFFVGVPLGAVSLALRMRRAQGIARTRLQWFFLAGIALVVGLVVPTSGAWTGVGLAVGLAALPLGIGVAMLRHGLFDVELTLNRTVVFGLLTVFVVLVYAGVVYLAHAVAAPGSVWGGTAVAVAALAAAAARDRVQAVVDRTLFGHRHDAYAVVAHVGRRVATASEPIAALQHLVDGLRDALRLPYAAYTGGEVSVAAGTPTHGTKVVTVRALGEAVGELHVGLRARGERLSAEEDAAIVEVAARAGTLACAAELVADVARSRGEIVATREEERRRLRADLHDGVAPALAGTALQLESLARQLHRDGQVEYAARTLALREGLRDTVAHLRALVHGLRPPVLDQRGLEGALRALVAGHEVPRCTAVVGPLGRTGAAVEVAAYAIAGEAFGNALRHSVATRIEIEATRGDGELLVCVRDDGIGLPARPRPGVGLVSMRERAAEIGGRLEVLATRGGGTTVRAVLPLEVGTA